MMTGKEYCRYIRTYSELKGLQHARTVLYCASTLPQGVLVELRREQDGRVSRSRVLTPADSFAQVMPLLRYLWHLLILDRQNVAESAIDRRNTRVYSISRFEQTVLFWEKITKVRCAICIWMSTSAGWQRSWRMRI